MYQTHMHNKITVEKRNCAELLKSDKSGQAERLMLAYVTTTFHLSMLIAGHRQFPPGHRSA